VALVPGDHIDLVHLDRAVENDGGCLRQGYGRNWVTTV
jgi:hypothetical protein